MKAVKENRVLTLIQAPASKRKDFGRIGFHQEAFASYLVFPKPLPKETKPRVIGIKYDLMEQPRVADPVDLTDPSPKPEKKTVRKRKAFEILLRRQATFETTVTIDDAPTVAAARKKAVQEMAAAPFDLTKAVMKNEVLDVRQKEV